MPRDVAPVTAASPPRAGPAAPERRRLSAPLVLLGAEQVRPALLGELPGLVLEPRHVLGHRRARGDPGESALDVGKVLDPLSLALVQPAPGEDRHVGDGVVARHVVAPGQSLAEYERQRPEDYNFAKFSAAHIKMCARQEDRDHWLEIYRKAGLPV